MIPLWLALLMFIACYALGVLTVGWTHGLLNSRKSLYQGKTGVGEGLGFAGANKVPATNLNI